jgi:hypothetical protein
MSDPSTSRAASAATAEDKEIRERVKDLTSQALQRGRVDPDAVRDIVRAVMGGTPGDTASGAEARAKFADAVRKLDEALVKSANEAHVALQQLASRGKDFTDNDLKEALVSLKGLQQDFAAAASRIGDAMTSNLRNDMMGLAVSAQNVGVEASARLAGMLGQIAGGMGSAPGAATIRDASTRMALAVSGLLAGVADALRDQPGTEKENKAEP